MFWGIFDLMEVSSSIQRTIINICRKELSHILFCFSSQKQSIINYQMMLRMHIV